MLKRLLNADAIFASIVLAISVGFYIMSLSFTRETVGGNVNEGFFPRMLAVGVALMALYIIIGSIKNNVHYFELKDGNKDILKTVGICMSLFVLYIISWNHVHFLIKTIIFLLAMCRVLKLKLLFSVIYSVVFSVGIYMLFTQAFRILL
ncbi:tripartite tricarboxylate transporter TctB family protein [Alkalibacter saccharofermentans]|uniref:Tripartite tricarboxylate transporter TctB family protein n=1 Tax=Alkalibacter saccharofermentans DSM 14828 TaxID=1120975 RepID=A0A1M4WH74_9FIRM|nr:tripartite tricarboxylate transporter TctB family protein [Alkalibacter saccharofermentans]SHE80510.1 Tripartite tricarboxylate transporter TctB family protein [Alkalibacter saccharofermentans DSM 14828]